MKTIAVDFDGTVVTHEYPKIGKEQPFAFSTLKELQKQGYRLILWTVRAGKELDEAIEYCRANGVEFYAVNKNYPEEKLDENNTSRKIVADIYIDDRNIGGFLGWSKIWQLLNQGYGSNYDHQENEYKHENNQGFLNKIGSFFKS